MGEIIWSDKMGHRGRQSWLILVKDDAAYKFDGVSIPDIATVIDSTYERNGKWSQNIYKIAIASGVHVIAGRDGWETGTFREGLACALDLPVMSIDTWIDLANALGVSLESARSLVVRNWIGDALHFDRVQREMEMIESREDDGTEVITLNWGCPTSRQMDAGYWETPIQVVLNDNVIAEASQEDAQAGKGFGERVSVVECVHVPGFHGGTYTLKMRVPHGARLRLKPADMSSDKGSPRRWTFE